MKSKCSFILKAGISLILCFILLFGTVATSLAAVVDDLAATGDGPSSVSGVYLVGSFNSWTSADSNFQLSQVSSNDYNHWHGTFYLPYSSTDYEFKLYLAYSSWGNGIYVSADDSGNFTFTSSVTSTGEKYIAQNKSNMKISCISSTAGYIRIYVEYWCQFSNNSKLNVTQTAVSALSLASAASTQSYVASVGTLDLTASVSGGSGSNSCSYTITDAADTDLDEADYISGNTFTAPDVDTPTLFKVTTEASDTLITGLTHATATRNIIVYPEIGAPSGITADDDKTHIAADGVDTTTLNCAPSNADAYTLTYEWTVDDANATVDMDGVDNSKATVSTDTPGKYTVTCTINYSLTAYPSGVNGAWSKTIVVYAGIPEGAQVLKASSGVYTDSADFYLYLFDSETRTHYKWIKASQCATTDGEATNPRYYYALVPAMDEEDDFAYDRMIWVRYDPNKDPATAGDNGWNGRWNQTGDITAIDRNMVIWTSLPSSGTTGTAGTNYTYTDDDDHDHYHDFEVKMYVREDPRSEYAEYTPATAVYSGGVTTCNPTSVALTAHAPGDAESNYTFNGWYYYDDENDIKTSGLGDANYAAVSSSVANKQTSIYCGYYTKKPVSVTVTVSAIKTDNGTAFTTTALSGFTATSVDDSDDELEITTAAAASYTDSGSTYVFDGWVKTTEPLTLNGTADDSLILNNNTKTSLVSADTSFSGEYTKVNAYYYAVYRKQYTISVCQSKEHEATSTLASAPSKININTTAGGSVYEYQSGLAATADNKYGDCTDINVLAGSTVTLYYSTLGTSDAIEKVRYGATSSNYATTDITDDDVFSDLITPACTIDQSAHSVQFVMGGASISGIAIQTGTLNRITVTDASGNKLTEGVTITGLANSGYYVRSGAVSFTVSPATSTTCTYAITGGSLYYNTADEHEDPVYAAYTDSPTLSYSSGTLSGTMPVYDIQLRLTVTKSYTMQLGSKMESDIVHSYFASDNDEGYSSGTTVGEITTYLNTKTTAATITSVTDPDKVIYSYEFTGDYANEYTFLGWYTSAIGATVPDYSKCISTAQTFRYMPTANVKVWAVVTHEFFIAGNFTVDSDGVVTRNNTTDSSSWSTNNFYTMTYDPEKQAYAYTFNNLEHGSRTSSGNPTSDAFFYNFKLYSQKSTASTALTYWDNVTAYGSNWIDKDSTHNMWKGKYASAGGSGIFELTDQIIATGYDAPATLYFQPSGTSGNSIWWIESSPYYRNIYVSNGYKQVYDYNGSSDADVTADMLDGAGAVEASVLAVTGDGWSPTYEGKVKHYKVKTKSTTLQLTKKLAQTGYADYDVTAFVIYNLTNRKTYSVTDITKVVESTYNTYTAKIDIGSYDDFYIIPVIEKIGAAITVYFDANQLDTKKWGDLVSCYAWYGTDTAANGSYPGQLMIPQTDGRWRVKFPASKGDDELSGITFANYVDGSYTWLGSSGVMGSGKLIGRYNYIYNVDSKGNSYTKENCKVQSYDYREPVSMYNAATDKTAITLSFAIKNGNHSYIGWTHNDMVTSNIFDCGSWSLDPDTDFEYLTDSTGNYYTDINGTTLENYPTPSFYVVAKGMATYSGQSLTKVFHSGNGYQSPSGITYGTAGQIAADDVDVTMVNAVQWYIYDASGNYIDTILSAAFADNAYNDAQANTKVVTKLLEEKGYAVTGKSIGISYDVPRYCYTSNNTGSSFDCYRFAGQWYSTLKTTPAKVSVQVGIITEAGIELADSNSSDYANATAVYDYKKGSSLYWSHIKTDKAKSYVTTTQADGENAPVNLTASEHNFAGWYYKDSYSGEYIKVETHTSAKDFYPIFASDATYYALYEVKAAYVMNYKDRNGNWCQYYVDHNLTPEEIAGYSGNGNNPGVPTYIWTSEAQTVYSGKYNPYTTAVANVSGAVSSYQYGIFTWPTVNASTGVVSNGAVKANPELKQCVVEAECTTNTYTVTYTVVNGTTAEHTQMSVPAYNVFSLSTSYDEEDGFTVAEDYASIPRANFSYWSSDPDGNNLITTNYNYNLIITHNTKIYAQYNKLVPSSVNWKSYIESLTKTRKVTSATDDTTYLDFNSLFVNKDSSKIKDLLSDEETDNDVQFGILIAYDTSGTFANATTIDSKAAGIIKYMADPSRNLTAAKSGTMRFALYNYKDANHISNLNRANFSIYGATDTIGSKNLSVYTYVYDGSTVYLSSTNFASPIGGSIENCGTNQLAVASAALGTTYVYN